MNRITKITVTATALLTGTFLIACSGGKNLNKKETFQNKTGVIGVFRQAAFYCSDVAPQYMTLGEKKILVKPSWSSEQDNIFFSEMKPGVATLYSYEYTCNNEENKLVLDTTDNGKRAFPVSVKIPDDGFCKIVISFLENDNLFSHDDGALSEQFMQNEVALRLENVPYCDVIDTKGNVVSFMDKDSLIRENYAAALKESRELTAENAYPLVALDGRSDLATTSGDNSQVVLVTWHNHPDKFADGSLARLEGEVLWAFTDKEFLKWFNENESNVSHWNLRLKQLMGKSPDDNAGYFTVFWANVKDVFRPAYIPEVGDVVMNGAFSASFEEDTSEAALWFKNWFKETQRQANARDGGFIWTRLGYTYDWGSKDSKYGLSQFIVRDGAEIEVKFTRGTKGFLNWIKGRNN